MIFVKSPQQLVPLKGAPFYGKTCLIEMIPTTCDQIGPVRPLSRVSSEIKTAARFGFVIGSKNRRFCASKLVVFLIERAEP
jgi:hypothetical protein